MEQDNHFPEFGRQPDEAYLQEWRNHIQETGYPERFDRVSSSRPEQMHNIVLLSEEIRVPTSIRDGGERVPCPFCSPGSPKFARGRMAYFPDESVVRFVGHRCAKSHFGENYAAAERLFDRQMRCRRYVGLWSEVNERRGEIGDLLDVAEPVAAAVEDVRERIEEQAPGFCSFLRRELAQSKGELTILEDLGQKDRAGNAVFQRTIIGTAAGLSYLETDARPLKVIRDARASLAKTSIDLPAWSATSPEHEATQDILRLGRGVAKCLRGVPEAIEVLRDAQAFLKARNIALIQRWGARSDSPFALFQMERSERQISIRVRSFAGNFFASPLAASEYLEASLPSLISPTLLWMEGLLA